MAKTRVAILEDDATLGAALKAAFDKVGCEAYLSNKPLEIQEFVEKNSTAALFVDCLLPSGSGVDFVESLRKKFPPAILDIVMMSGIFTDSAVVKEILHSTKAIAFLKKPFELQEALNLVKVKETFDIREEVSPRKALYFLFNKPKVTVREKRKAIEALEEIHGFDLPYLYSLLVETMATGHLNIVGLKGDVLGISFSEGRIVSVDLVDQETQLGNLLIEAGFIRPDDLKEALSSNSPKKLGERLIHGNLLSPHAFNIALANQMSIRLSRTIVEVPVKVNFVATDVELTHPYVDSDALSVFLHDWIASKIDFEWLKAHYVQWGEYSLAKSQTYSPDHPILSSPLLLHLKGFVDHFTTGKSLNELMDSKKYPEETAYKALHLLLAKGVVIFGEKAESHDPVERLKTLRKLLAQFQNKNKLEVWDLLVSMTNASSSDPQYINAEFKRIVGSPPDARNADLQKVYQQLVKIGEDALKFAQGGDRQKMAEEIAKQGFEDKMKAASLFEEAKAALQKAQYAQAMAALTKAGTLDPNLEKLKLYMIWGRLSMAEQGSGVKPALLKEIEMDLLQVPPEEKYDAIFSFVMGLIYKYRGDSTNAKKSFEKAYNLDSNFFAARREISILMQKNKKSDVLNADLKDLVAGFFKRK
jgi:FixJ family two-component response regulator/predicted negative regulator of RcsB-dependent stress response